MNMDSAKKPAERLIELLAPVMEREGYAYRKSGHRFVKPFRHGKHEFSLIFDGRGGLVAVDAGFFVYFEALLKQFKAALGHPCPWAAGASLLNAGANPWKFWLFEERFARMTPQERAGIPSEEIHPQLRMEECVRFLTDAHARFAVPLFQSLQTYRQLADFYKEYLTNGCSGRCRPLAENVVYLSLFLAALLDDDLNEIAAFARGMQSVYAGHDVHKNIEKVLAYVGANDMKRLLT